MRKLVLTSLAVLTLAGCVAPPDKALFGEAPRAVPASPTGETLRDLPPPVRPIPVAVYQFDDETGQHKPNETFSDYSKAVTQGAAALLIETLVKAGDGKWFTVLERNRLGNLLQERKIIDTTRETFAGPEGEALPPLGPLLYAGLLIEGGVVGYDSDVMTGGAGARYLGIGGSTQYRRDIVTVALRVTSVKTGEVLRATSASKTIFSVAVQGGAFKFVALEELLEIEAGFTFNEPVLVATRQAIERSVLDLVAEGAGAGLWAFADPVAGASFLDGRLADAALAAPSASAEG